MTGAAIGEAVPAAGGAASRWVPAGLDDEVPSAARVYDFLLGGGHNFSVDRALAANLIEVLPARDMARLNRQYLGRAVRHLLDQGITQFLDLGSGIPTVGNVHEVAQKRDPGARVVYVDNESVAIAHSVLMLRDNPNAAAVQADIRQPEAIFDDPEVRRLIDFSQPLGLLMVGVLHFVSDDEDPWALTDTYRAALAPGSHFALSALTGDNDRGGIRAAVDVFARSRDPIFPRTHGELLRMFGDFDLLEPGLVHPPRWRPEQAGDVADAARANVYAGVAVKR